jgi:hypothetical protein
MDYKNVFHAPQSRKICIRCNQSRDELEITNCVNCDEIVCHNCSILLPDEFKQDGGSVCRECYEPYIATASQCFADSAEEDDLRYYPRLNPADTAPDESDDLIPTKFADGDSPFYGKTKRLVLQGTIIQEDESFVLKGVRLPRGRRVIFCSTDYIEGAHDWAALEPSSIWKPLRNYRVEISCRIATRNEERCTERGHPCWINAEYIVAAKLRCILAREESA